MAHVRVPFKLFGRKVPFLSYDLSISDPGFAALLHMGYGSAFGPYSVYSALQNPAYWRGVVLISGTIASLPLRTFKTSIDDDGDQIRVKSASFLDDNPSGPYGLTPFAWRQLIVLCLVTEQECGLLHVTNNAGALIGLMPVHPNVYSVKWIKGEEGIGRQFQLAGENEPRHSDTFTQILGLSLDGLRGVSSIGAHQRAIQLAAAQDIAAMRTMTNGMHIAGLVAPKDEDIDEADAKAIKAGLDAKVNGPENAGGLAMVNKRLVFTPWTQTNTDAQFDQGRRYSREEAALILGLPQYMLEPSKQTSWGTGISEQNAGLARYTFMPITGQIEAAISPLLSPNSKFIEFDYKGLLQGTPEIEVKIVLQQLAAGLISEEESRQLLGWGPKDPTDTFRTPEKIGARGVPPVENPATEQGTPAPTASSNGSAQ